MAQKSKKKLETVPYASPFGTARIFRNTLNKPDTEGEFPDGKFKTGVILEEEDVEGERAKFIAAAKKLLPNVPIEDVKLPLKEFFRKNDDGEKVPAGEGFEAKSKRRPLILDARKNKLPENVMVGGGSTLRVGGAIAAYRQEKEETIIENGKKRKEKVVQHGLTIYLNSVQVKSLSQGGQSDGSEFDEVEGYEFEGGEDATVGGDDATDF